MTAGFILYMCSFCWAALYACPVLLDYMTMIKINRMIRTMIRIPMQQDDFVSKRSKKKTSNSMSASPLPFLFQLQKYESHQCCTFVLLDEVIHSLHGLLETSCSPIDMFVQVIEENRLVCQLVVHCTCNLTHVKHCVHYPVQLLILLLHQHLLVAGGNEGI